MKLTELVNKKRAELGDIEKFKPKTNCLLKADMKIDCNIHTLGTVEQATNALIVLGLYKLAAKEAGISDDEVIINGFPLNDWISDVTTKRYHLEHKVKEAELISIEKQLEGMLSEDKKTELK